MAAARKRLKKIGPGVYVTGRYLIVRTTDRIDRYKKLKSGRYSIMPHFIEVTYWSLYRKNTMAKPVYRGLTIQDCLTAAS